MRTLAILPLLMFAMSSVAQKSESSNYGNNIVTISPFSVYGSDLVSDVFAGLNYERVVNDYMSLGTQVAVAIQEEGFQIGLSPKFYPSGHDKVVSYGIAPTFLYTKSLSNNFYYYESVDDVTFLGSRLDRVSQFGFMLVNSMNVTLNEHVHFALDGGIGVNYISEVENDVNYQYGPDVTGIIRCNIGYRF